MLNVWRPDYKFKFPISGTRNLKFQLAWLAEWEWLAYSKEEDGAYCLWCSLFPPSSGGRSRVGLGKLVHTKFSQWKNAKEEFRAHQNLQYHDDSRLKVAGFLSVACGKQDNVHMQLDTAQKRKVGFLKYSCVYITFPMDSFFPHRPKP